MATDNSSSSRKLTKSEITTIRLDPKLKYLAELAARKQRRTLSSYIEWAVDKSLEQVVLREWENSRDSVADEASKLWDVDEADRMAILALHHPDLLNHEEQLIWKLVKENGKLWRGRYNDNDEWTWKVQKVDFMFARLREYWPLFKAVAAGEKSVEELPTWRKFKDGKVPSTPAPLAPPPPPPATKGGFEDMDDDIPF